MNEESDYSTFRSSQGTSNIDLTVISDQLLRKVVELEISEQESCSGHSIIKYAIGQGKGHTTELDFQEVRYIVPRVELLVSHRVPLRVADRGTIARYGGYRGNKIPGADQNQYLCLAVDRGICKGWRKKTSKTNHLVLQVGVMRRASNPFMENFLKLKILNAGIERDGLIM